MQSITTLDGKRLPLLDISQSDCSCFDSLCCQKPFESSLHNLHKILGNAVKGYQEARKSQKRPRRPDFVKDSIECLENLCFALLFSQSSQNPVKIAGYIETFASSLSYALDIPAKPTSLVRPSFLDHSMVFKMAIVMMMLIQRVENPDIRPICFALTANFFLILVEATERRLESQSVIRSLINDDHDHSIQDAVDAAESTPEMEDTEEDASSVSDIEFSTDSNETESEESELEERDEEDSPTKLPSRRPRARHPESDVSDWEEDMPVDKLNALSLLNDSDLRVDKKDVSKEVPIAKNVTPTVETTSCPLFAVFPKLHLQSLKVLIDFISNSKELMNNNELKDRLQDRMVNVVNIFVQMEAVCFDSLGMDSQKRASPEWKQETALDCDWSLVLFPLLHDVHQHLEFTPGKRVSDKESGIVCIQRFISFALFLAQETGRYVWSAEAEQLKPA